MFADPWIAVVDKPHGMHSQETPARTGASVVEVLRGELGALWLVHRLDRDAAGLLVLARTQPVAAALSADLRAHRVERTYHAEVAVPLPIGTEGTIDRPLRWAGGRCWVDPSGVAAVTRYRVLSAAPGATLLEVRLETGRMHQIRVHLASALGPILGDTTYGGRPAPALALRAVRLGLTHPHTGVWSVFERPDRA